LLVLGASWTLSPAGAETERADGVHRETTGWHIVRPGESLEQISVAYLGERSGWKSLVEWNPPLALPSAVAAGDRVQVHLRRGLPPTGSIVSRMSGEVLALPDPVAWTRGRIFDLLVAGDGLRTLNSASVELSFADSSRLLIGEESLLFLGEAEGSETRRVGDRRSHPDTIEVVTGQVDLKSSVTRELSDDFEIVLGQARIEARSDSVGLLDARAKKDREGAGQVMVYQGEGRVRQAGTVVQLHQGSGVMVPLQGPLPKPETLLSPPLLVGPDSGAVVALDRFVPTWTRPRDAQSVTLEICRDAECGVLVQRSDGLTSEALHHPALPAGSYYWRVRGVSPSGLDGYPSESRRIELRLSSVLVAEDPEAPPNARLQGTVKERVGGRSLPGATVQLLELGLLVKTTDRGEFDFSDLPAGVYTLETLAEGHLPTRLERVSVPAGADSMVDLTLDVLPTAFAEVVVTPSQMSLGEGAPMSPLALSRDDIVALPHLADDLFRALPLLPGTTANDISAEFHVRGGRRDTVDVRLEGQELYEAYHLRDFDGALSVVAPSAVGAVDLRTGGFPVQFGDRMGAVLEMFAATAPPARQLELGLGVLTSRVGSRGTLPEGRGSWIAITRTGSTRLARELLKGPGPEYWDLFSKCEVDFGDQQTLSVRTLLANDRLDFQEVIDEESKHHRTQHDSSYFWVTHQSILGRRLFVDSGASWSRIERDRLAIEIEEEQTFDLLDRRSFDVGELRQGWNGQLSTQHLLSWGGEYRRYEAMYDAHVMTQFDTPVAHIRTLDSDETVAIETLINSDHLGIYAADQWRPSSALTLEVGGRYDRHSLLGEELFSPRISIAWAAGPSTVLRTSWGLFHQSQRPYELAVSDGATEFSPAERSEHRIVGVEHTFGSLGSVRRVALRVEAYQRLVGNPRPRYENLFESFNNFPELEPDRVRIAPLESRAQGIEVFVRGATRGGIDAWANYTWSRSEDRLAEGWVPRDIDQTHALNLGLSFPVKAWTATLAWRYHTGWPTTPLSFVVVPEELAGDPEGGFEGEGESEVEVAALAAGELEYTPVLGGIYSDRLSNYHRLDLRLRRGWQLRSGGRFEFYIDVQNLYNRRNHAGFDFVLDDSGTIETVAERWPGIVPSLGVSWTF
ncbi:MAG: TonB-dependent receptor, partial [Thermoanaerobaculia bacterium]|nr:TonB-dependent receptor [Thermoanaerobaculia bacterium]